MLFGLYRGGLSMRRRRSPTAARMPRGGAGEGVGALSAARFW
jgi:hypothetical protein